MSTLRNSDQVGLIFVPKYVEFSLSKMPSTVAKSILCKKL